MEVSHYMNFEMLVKQGGLAGDGDSSPGVGDGGSKGEEAGRPGMLGAGGAPL